MIKEESQSLKNDCSDFILVILYLSKSEIKFRQKQGLLVRWNPIYSYFKGFPSNGFSAHFIESVGHPSLASNISSIKTSGIGTEPVLSSKKQTLNPRHYNHKHPVQRLHTRHMQYKCQYQQLSNSFSY